MTSKTLKEMSSLRCFSPSPSEDDGLSLSSPKRGRKESEQRRRVMMNQYFDELITLLSMLSERCIPKKMDKATTLHEAVQCIQIYSDLTSKPDKTLVLDVGKTPKSSNKAPPSPPVRTDPLSEGSIQGLHTVGELLHFFLDAHDAFLLVISDSGRIIFSSELITSLLGHMQTRLVGQNFFDFLHENDHQTFQNLLKLEQSRVEGVKLKDRPIIAFPPQLVQCQLKLYAGETGYFPQYLLFKSIAYLRKWDADRSKAAAGGGGDASPASPDPSSSESSYSVDQENQSCLVMIGKLPTSLSMVDLPVGTNDVNFEFDMRVSREGRVIDIDKHAVTVLGFTASEIIGTSFFDYIDPYHLTEVSECMSTFLSNGLGTTTPYRLLTKGGRSMWLMSKGYLSYNPWNNKPDHILLTNRVLGCDQVLPEHRFFRSRKFLPDLEGHECYLPQILVNRQTSHSQPPPMLETPTPTAATCSTAAPTADSSLLFNQTENQYNPSDLSGSILPLNQLTSQHQGQNRPTQLSQFAPSTVNVHSLQQQLGQIPQPGGHEGRQQIPQSGSQGNGQQIPSQSGGGQRGDRQQILQTTPTGPSAQTPVTPSPVPIPGDIGRSASLPQIQMAESSKTLPQPTPTTTTEPPAPPQPVAQVQNFEDIQRELDRKNREIFEMQKRLFEQQQLFEKERSQFYSITAQVMQCISSNALNQLPQNMQMVFSTSSDYHHPSSMLNVQSKGVLDDHMRPNAQVPYSSDMVQSTPTTTLWDSGSSVSLGPGPGVFSENSHLYPLQQQQHHSHPQPQIRQSPYSGTPPTTMPASTVHFSSGDYIPANSPGLSSVSSMPHDHSDSMLSEQFGLSQAFKMSGHQSLAEHNLQFFHQIPQPGAQQGQGVERQHGGNSGRQGQQSSTAQQQQQSHQPPTTHHQARQQPQAHLHQQQPQLSAHAQSPGGYGALMSPNILSNLASSPSPSLSLPSLPVSMHSQKLQTQQNVPSQNLADILNSARFS